MKKSLKYFFFGVAVTFLLGLGGLATFDYIRVANYIDITSSTLPAVAPSGTARIYVDSVSGTPLVSANQANYVPMLAQPKSNYIMNPDGQISQRISRTGSLQHATDTYGFDRWKLCNSTGGNCISQPSDSYLNRINTKVLSSNSVQLGIDCPTATITGEHVTVACKPADATMDGVIVANANSVSSFFNYPITHSNITFQASGGSLKEQGLVGNSYMTFYNNSGSSGKMLAIQVLDAFQIQNLRSRTATIQFKLKGTSGIGNVHCSLIQWATSATSVGQENATWANPFVATWGASGTEPVYTATGSYNYSNITAINSFTNYTGSIVNSVYSAPAGADWTQFGFTTVLPYDYNQIAIAFWTDSVVTSGNFFSITELGMYDAQEIQPYSVRPYQQELTLCQRYYWSFFGGTTNGQGSIALLGAGATTSTSESETLIQFPVTMRTTPVFSYTGTNGHLAFTTVFIGMPATSTPAIRSAGLNSPTAMMISVSGAVSFSGSQLPGWLEWTSSTTADQLQFNADY